MENLGRPTSYNTDIGDIGTYGYQDWEQLNKDDNWRKGRVMN
jgi:hypothetical protein